MTPLKDLVCINCHDHCIRVVLTLERHLYLQCDGCGAPSTMPERRASRPGRSPHQRSTRTRRSKPQ
jgi:hypothetical protein